MPKLFQNFQFTYCFFLEATYMLANVYIPMGIFLGKE